MCWHNRLGHIPFPRLKQLTLNVEIPKKLAKLTPPKCTGCLCGAITKLPWSGKETKSSCKVFVGTKAGECFSIKQMTTSEVGFYVVQLNGKLTKKRYRCATIFVDHFSRLQIIHLQINNLSAKTVAAKHAFKQYAAEHSVKIKPYHCNNGHFHNNAFQ
jgi:hypothetical protein